MKILILILITFSSLSGFAFQDGDLNINGSIGLYGSRGLVGVSFDKFISPNQVLSAAAGLDIVGAISSLGYKYFTDKFSNQGPWAKCFSFDCDSHFYFGPSIQYAGATTLKITEGANEREYKTDSKWFGLISVGIRDVFRNKMSLDFEISYRNIVSGGKATQNYGALVDDTETIEKGYRSVGASIAMGYVF